MKRLLVLGLVLVAAGCGRHEARSDDADIAFEHERRLRAASARRCTVVPAARPGREDSSGPQQERGHWTIVTFLYTHCPDVCPLVTNQLVAAQRVDTDLRVIAVSVDPKRDTPSAVRTFLAAHGAGPRFRFVIGSRAALARVWKRYHVASVAGPKGTVEHSTFEILVDPSGHERVFFDSRVKARDVTSALKNLKA